MALAGHEVITPTGVGHEEVRPPGQSGRTFTMVLLGDVVFGPVADTELESGGDMIVPGQEDQITRLREYARG